MLERHLSHLTPSPAFSFTASSLLTSLANANPQRLLLARHVTNRPLFFLLPLPAVLAFLAGGRGRSSALLSAARRPPHGPGGRQRTGAGGQPAGSSLRALALSWKELGSSGAEGVILGSSWGRRASQDRAGRGVIGTQKAPGRPARAPSRALPAPRRRRRWCGVP